MSSFLRRSTGLARLAGNACVVPSRTSLRLARSPRIASAAFARLATRPTRYYSSDNKPSNDADKAQKNKDDAQIPEIKSTSSPGPADGAKFDTSTRIPLPKGWVYLSESEYDLLKQHFKSINFKGTDGLSKEEFLNAIMRAGVPGAVRDLMVKGLNGKLSVLLAAPRVLMHVPEMAAHYSNTVFSERIEKESASETQKSESQNAESASSAGSAEGQTPSQISADKSGKFPLPDGWVYLTEEEHAWFKAQFTNAPWWLGGTSDAELEVIEYMARTGVPKEFADVIGRNMKGDIALSDLKTLTEGLHPLRRRIEEVKGVQKTGNNTFFSQKKPGEEGAKETSEKKAEDESTSSQEDKKKASASGETEGGRPPGTDYTTTIIGTLIAYWLYNYLFDEGGREITWQELRNNFLNKGLVERMVVTRNRVRVYLNREATQSVYPDSPALKPGFFYYFSIGSVDSFERHLDEAQDDLGIPNNDKIPVSYQGESNLTNLILAFGPTLLFVGLIYWVSRRGAGGGAGGAGGIFNFGKSRAKKFNHEASIQVKFADVAGLDEAKVEIMEFVEFLKTPERFSRLGAKIPRGAILAGPPGTGKTMLARATAGESGVPFFSVSGSEFVEMFVGVGASRVRDLFSTARRNAPCIIFIDEIDAIGKSRAEGQRFGGNDEREATLNQILTEMDGFNTTEQVVVLAGTNRVDILDKALMRPGRFDRHINIDRPTMKGRQDIFQVYLKKIVTHEELEHLSGRLATLTPGFAGADIANCVNEAALIAARENAQSVTLKHFEQAIERVIGGLERKSLVLNPEEKRTVAYHEAGHAICGWYFQYADPLLKVSIIPRGSAALGYAQYVPGDAYLMTYRQLMDRMAMTLGGRISEELHFPTVTTGASDDFKKVTQMAAAMVTQWGMSEKVGPLHFRSEENQVQKPFAESTAQVIDSEVRRIVDDAYKQCKDLLISRKKEVGLVAEELLRKEMLTRDDMIRLLGPRPFDDKGEFNKYFGAEMGADKSTEGAVDEKKPSPPPEDSGDAPSGSSPQPTVFKALEGKESR